MPLETPARIVRTFVGRGYSVEREAVTLIAGSDNPGRTLAHVVEAAPDDTLRITADRAREVLASAPAADPSGTESTPSAATDAANAADTDPAASAASGPSVSVVTLHDNATHTGQSAPAEAQGTPGGRNVDPALQSLEIANDMIGRPTGTGEYDDFVKVFRDRYEKLSKLLRGRVSHRPAKAISNVSDDEDAELIGLVDDMRSTKSGHWIIDLKDTTGTFPCLVMKDKDIAGYVDELLMDECIAVQGTLSGDTGVFSIDSMHFPDVLRSHRSNTAGRDVRAALISDVYVGSQEFMADAWNHFAGWLHTEEAARIEYLLIVGDMVEGVGVYPNQDEELDIIDIYKQYEAFSEYLKSVPGDLEIVIIPGNHDAVRLAEPQPGFDDELRDIMSTHDARITNNPLMATLEGVSVLMYHGVSLGEVITGLPADKASYDEPHKAMYQLLGKHHATPQFGGHTRLAPEELDYLVMENMPDIFHTGHVHKLGWGKYHNVLAINSDCWQVQTDFQKSVNIDPDAGYAPIVDLDTLNTTVRKFSWGGDRFTTDDRSAQRPLSYQYAP